MIDSNHNINYQEIAQAIQQKREQSPEFKNLSDKEIIGKVLNEHIERAVPAKAPNAPMPATQSQSDDSNLPNYAASADFVTKKRVEELINLTLEKGIVDGVKHVKNQDPYIIDLYHDAMVEKLHDEMKKRNLI